MQRGQPLEHTAAAPAETDAYHAPVARVAVSHHEARRLGPAHEPDDAVLAQL